jgi:hypothetical protein
MLNLNYRNYFDGIIDGVPSSFSEDSNFEENEDEKS